LLFFRNGINIETQLKDFANRIAGNLEEVTDLLKSFDSVIERSQCDDSGRCKYSLVMRDPFNETKTIAIDLKGKSLVEEVKNIEAMIKKISSYEWKDKELGKEFLDLFLNGYMITPDISQASKELKNDPKPGSYRLWMAMENKESRLLYPEIDIGYSFVNRNGKIENNIVKKNSTPMASWFNSMILYKSTL